MDMLRRIVLKGAGAAGALTLLLAAGALRPLAAHAATWNKAAFEADTVEAAFAALGVTSARADPRIDLVVPEYAENGGIVPVTVTADLPGMRSVAIFVHENHTPLAAMFECAEGRVAEIAVRLKFADSSIVEAVVGTGQETYAVRRQVNIVMSGCEH